MKKIMDGNTAAAFASYPFTEVAAIYPITPASPMADVIDSQSNKGLKNAFGQQVKVMEFQSEGGAAGGLHGALVAGTLASTYTSSQGLLLMIPNMYKIAGQLLPAVMHVSSRALSQNGITIFCDHADVMATQHTGFALLSSANAQEAMDLGTVAHLAAIKGSVPVLHFFDGFRTSHELRDIDVLDPAEVSKLIDKDALSRFRKRALNPASSSVSGVTVNADVFFQLREAATPYYEAFPAIVEEYMGKINAMTGRDYKLFNYYGAPDAERVIVCMGSGCETIQETVDYLAAKGEKVGVVTVHLFRPFVNEKLRAAIPATAKKIAVLDRTKDAAASGEPLYLDVRSAYYGVENAPVIVGGRYGVGGKEFDPGCVLSIFENLALDEPKDRFTVNIVDDLSNSNLPAYKGSTDVAPHGTIACKFWGYGSDGTVGANKNTIKIIGSHTDMHTQAYFFYDSKKSGGVTISHLRFGKNEIKSAYLINENADFIACHKQAYIGMYDIVDSLKDGGTFLLNCEWTHDELDAELPAKVKRFIAEHNINFYTINAARIADELGLSGRTNQIMQAAFFKITGILPIDEAEKYMKEMVVTTYGKKGEKVVRLNHLCIEAGLERVEKVEVPESWKTLDEPTAVKGEHNFVNDVFTPIAKLKGDLLPVSAFKNITPDTFPVGTTKLEKRGVALDVPSWLPENCIQCNRCAAYCPHAVIRPVLLDEAEAGSAPDGYAMKDAVGFEGKKFHITISALDCTGCGNCVQACPAKEKALVMQPLHEVRRQAVADWDYSVTVKEKDIPEKMLSTLKGTQFKTPLFEFSGACAGCGETPYIKMLTQLFGDRMIIANPAGCTSAYSACVPSVAYTRNQKGRGPAWGFSLFEDNAEFGMGMKLATNQIRARLLSEAKELNEAAAEQELKTALSRWMDDFNTGSGTFERAEALETLLEKYSAKYPVCGKMLEEKDYLVKPSHWLVGGDGWAYDIGFGGLDHVLAAGDDINVLVLDTEVYSNTGGQASKSTPSGAVAQYASGGKRTAKKDLGKMLMSYGYIYVAQVCMGADPAQVIKAMREAEAYNGPSVVIAYCPCINHGIHSGMKNSQLEGKKAVDTGYWSLYRYNPKALTPFTLDSKEPTGEYREFISGEVRYSSLKLAHADEAEALYEKSESDSKHRREGYKQLAQQKQS